MLKLQPCRQPLDPLETGDSTLAHSIYPFLNQNLFFFFFAASATVRQPRRSTAGKRGWCWHHTQLWILILIRNLPPLLSLPLSPFVHSRPVGRSDPNAHTGRQGKTLRGSLDAANGSNWRMCVALAPALIHQEFRFVACNACVSIRASDWNSLVHIRIFFSPYHQLPCTSTRVPRDLISAALRMVSFITRRQPHPSPTGNEGEELPARSFPSVPSFPFLFPLDIFYFGSQGYRDHVLFISQKDIRQVQYYMSGKGIRDTWNCIPVISN